MKRNYGIDLLRIVSMWYVIILHTLGHGGVLANLPIGTIRYASGWTLETIAYCAVDCFAIISGYVGYREEDRKYKLSNYFQLWFEVVFYCFVISFSFFISGRFSVTGNMVFESFFPVLYGKYWYFTAYAGLFFLIPLLNKAVQKCSKDTLRNVFFIVIAYSFFNTVVDRFGFQGGYSTLWLAILYIVGAIIKKCEVGKNLTFLKSVIGIVICVILTMGQLLANKSVSFAGVTIGPQQLVSYVSPTIFCMSVMYVIGFSKLKIRRTSKKIISFCAPSAFAGYLINDNSVLRDNILTNRFVLLVNVHSYTMIIVVVGFAFMFLMLSILVDKVRTWVFTRCKIDVFSRYLEVWIRTLASIVRRHI